MPGVPYIHNATLCEDTNQEIKLAVTLAIPPEDTMGTGGQRQRYPAGRATEQKSRSLPSLCPASTTNTLLGFGQIAQISLRPWFPGVEHKISGQASKISFRSKFSGAGNVTNDILPTLIYLEGHQVTMPPPLSVSMRGDTCRPSGTCRCQTDTRQDIYPLGNNVTKISLNKLSLMTRLCRHISIQGIIRSSFRPTTQKGR